MDRKSEKVPPSALSLYVKLYCKKKGSTDTKYRNNLMEATKSWVSLTDQEKQQFYEKLNVYKSQHTKQFAEYLKNAKPYLKRKQSKRTSYNYGEEYQDLANPNINVAQCQQSDTTFETHSKTVVNESNTKTEDIEFIKSNWEEQIEEQNLLRNADSMEYIHGFTTAEVLPEPTPPNVKTSEELFKIVQAMEGSNDRSWKSLTKPEKIRYRNATLKLKKNYIIKYKAYLENLPAKILFDHYNKQLVK